MHIHPRYWAEIMSFRALVLLADRHSILAPSSAYLTKVHHLCLNIQDNARCTTFTSKTTYNNPRYWAEMMNFRVLWGPEFITTVRNLWELLDILLSQ